MGPQFPAENLASKPSMKLLGTRNWYLPAWLEWIPNVSIEGVPSEEPEPESEREYATV